MRWRPAHATSSVSVRDCSIRVVHNWGLMRGVADAHKYGIEDPADLIVGQFG